MKDTFELQKQIDTLRLEKAKYKALLYKQDDLADIIEKQLETNSKYEYTTVADILTNNYKYMDLSSMYANKIISKIQYDFCMD